MRNLLYPLFLDSPPCLFMPPSRYIIYGAEVTDSLPPPPHPHPPHDTYQATWTAVSEESDSDSVGEIDDSEASRVQLDDITGDQGGRDCRNLDESHRPINQVTVVK